MDAILENERSGNWTWRMKQVRQELVNNHIYQYVAENDMTFHCENFVIAYPLCQTTAPASFKFFIFGGVAMTNCYATNNWKTYTVIDGIAGTETTGSEITRPTKVAIHPTSVTYPEWNEYTETQFNNYISHHGGASYYYRLVMPNLKSTLTNDSAAGSYTVEYINSENLNGLFAEFYSAEIITTLDLSIQNALLDKNIYSVTGTWNPDDYANKALYYNDVMSLLDVMFKECCIFIALLNDANYSPFAVDFTVWIDGSKKPSVDLTWSSPFVGEGGFWSADDIVIKVYCNQSLPFSGDAVFPVTTCVWNENDFKTSYLDLLKIADYDGFTGVLENLAEITNTATVNIICEGETSNGYKTGKFFARLFYKTEETMQENIHGVYSGDGFGTITIKEGTPDNDDDGNVPDDDTDDEVTPEVPGINALSLLTKTYSMSPARLQSLGTELWGSFIDNIKLVNNSPIENIVSCKLFPFEIIGNQDELLQIGNVEMSTYGKPVTSSYSFKKTIGNLTIPEKYNSFLDYEPYTKITVFLPYIGFKELPTNIFMNKTLNLYYICDLLTGACKAVISIDNYEILSFDGSIGIDIPLSSQNRASVEMSYITSALGVVSSANSGNIIGALDKSISGAIAGFHTNTTGQYQPSCGFYEIQQPYVIIDRPAYYDIDGYSHAIGNKCNLTKTISNLTGYTIMNGSVDLNGIGATENEMKMIKDILTTGFYA